MDFELQYTREQEEFRQEVRAWLDENANCPPELGEIPIEPDNMTYEMWQWARDFQRKLGSKGWLYPLWPKEYGGGGLTAEHDIIIKEELQNKKYPVAYSMANMAMPAIFVYGTDEQKQRFLNPMLQGDRIPWQLFTEPSVGSDLASLITRADKDGDDFIINGQKTFVGGHHTPDYLWTLAVTDQDAPRHQNIGAFIVPGDLPGITIKTLDLVVKEGKRLISFDDVRVPREYLIGGETQGWRVAQTTLEIEHGAAGFVEQRDTLLEEIAKYCKDSLRNGKPVSQDPFAQQELVGLHIEANIQRLLGLRNYHMFNSNQPVTYHGSQNSLIGKDLTMKAAERVLNALGPYDLTNDDNWGPLNGRVEYHFRHELASNHRGGTSDVQKLIMARRIGVSRTQERAAPTQGTQAG